MFPFHYHERDAQYGRPQARPAGQKTFQTAGPAGKYSINQPRTHKPAELQPCIEVSGDLVCRAN